MRQIVETRTLHTFSELSDNVQSKKKEKERDYLGQCWYDFESESYMSDYADTLHKEGFLVEPKDIHYSISYSQGDGLSFVGEVDLSSIINEFFVAYPKYKIYEQLIISGDFDLNCTIVRHTCRYVHEHTVGVHLDYNPSYMYFDDEETKTEKIKFLSTLEKFIEEKQVNICKKLYKSLVESYEFYCSDERVLEQFEDKEFYADGTEYVE